MKIYLDNAATSAMDPRVLTAMGACQAMRAMNASSSHKPGILAAQAVEKAREIIAKKIQAKAEEIFFTSGGTEANNLAIKGVAFANRGRGKHIITSQIEHPSVLETTRWLEKQGFEITRLKVDKEGFVSPRDIEKAIKEETLLVSVMHTNNEIGTIEPIKEIGSICRHRNVYFHSDACQSLAKTELSVINQNLDLVSLNAHKIHGPKGIGVLYVRKGTKIESILHGGGQEGGLRSGTHNTEGIVGFGKAVEIADETDISKMEKMRDKLLQKIKDNIIDVDLNGPRDKRLCNNIHLRFRSVSGQSLSRELNQRDIYVSVGAACFSTKTVPSHVLLALGMEPEAAQETIRISLSRWTTLLELDSVVQALRKVVQHLRRKG